MTTMKRSSLWVSCLLALSAASAVAQTDQAAPPAPPPAHLSIIEGQAFIDRDGRSEAAVANVPLLDGDRLRTEEGRLEVILPDGSLLHVDRNTMIDVMASDLLRLLEGRVYVIVRGVRHPERAVRYQVDAPVASVQTAGPGEFRVWAAENSSGCEVELAVFRGQATIGTNYGVEDLLAGERSIARDGLAPSPPQYFNSARWDDFDRWSADRRSESLGTESAQYLPPELEVYGSTFDRYGTWRDDAVDGAVWYPTVTAGWRPYSVGYWRTYPSWGSFWIGSEPWGWPTHHYGYWGFSFNFGWYWRPSTLWGPAWVSWAYSPGYVSWCPLGRHGHPVFGHFGVHGLYNGYHADVWRGWTVVPRQHFGRPMPVNRVAVDGNRLDPVAQGAFAARRNGAGSERAVPRPAAAGGLAVPRLPTAGAAAAPRGGSGTAPRGLADPGRPARPDGGRATVDSRTRPSPEEAARIFGSTVRSPGQSSRRALPAAPAFGGAGRQTEAPASAPDVAAFSSRRARSSAAPEAAGPGASAQSGARAPARFGNRTPAQFGNGAPAQFGNGSPAVFGGSARPRAYPRATPAPADSPSGVSRQRGAWADSVPSPGAQVPSAGFGTWSQPSPGREVPYLREGGSRPEAAGRQAYPRYGEGPAPSAPRESPSMRGGGGLPAAPGVRGGAPGTSSAPQSAPRYNPGSGSPHPRGGGAASPQARPRGGRPD